MRSAADEGVIKFDARHRAAPLRSEALAELACTLIAWRTILVQIGVVGQDERRYGGAGFGNVSARVAPFAAERGARRFFVSGTQTGGKPCLSADDFCLVERCDIARNRVQSTGPVAPSSESMTHGAIYDLGPHIRFVFHGHAPVLWRAAERLRLPTTRPEVPYGTPAMAREVVRLYRESSLAEQRILAMGGHEDGIVAFGASAEEVGGRLVAHLARAYGEVCRRDARVWAP